MEDLAQRLQHTDYSVTEMADGTAVVLDLRNENLLTLNGSAAFMLACLRAGDDEARIVDQVIARYGIDAETARRDVATFLARLAEAVEGR